MTTDNLPKFAKGEYINSYFIGYDATGVGEVDAILFRIARAAKAYHSTECWCDPPFGSTDDEPTLNDLIQHAAVEAADEIERLRAIVDRIPADRLNPWHTVTVHATGWHMAHPIDCNLSECPFDGLAQAEWTEPPTAEGVWRWHVFEDQPWEWQEEQP